MKWLKKSLLMAMILLSMFCTVGFGTKKVELKDEAPLIDLEAAIKISDIGKQGNQTAINEKKPEKVAQENVQKSESQTINKEPVEVINKDIYQISIQDEKIKFGNEIVEDVETLEMLIEQKCTEHSKIILKDDYAEAHVYRMVLEMIEEQKQMIGFELQQK